MPLPSWLTVPLPEMAADIVVLLLWLKLIVPVPAPKATVGALIVPAASLVPKRPMFSVPEDPFEAAMTIFEAATMPPPLTFSAPEPERPTSIVPLVTDRRPLLMLTELFDEPAATPMTRLVPPLTWPPLEMMSLLPLPLKPT